MNQFEGTRQKLLRYLPPDMAVPWGTFVLLLIVQVAASFFPEVRAWSVNQLGYLPVWTVAVLPLVAAAVAAAAVGMMKRASWSLESRTFWYIAAALAGVALLSFVVFRVQYYFLGDGYTTLTLIASDNPLIKLRNFGGMIVPYGLTHLLGHGTEAVTLKAYQLVAYVAGGLLLLITVLTARKLYASAMDRVLFVLGFCSGGHMLLFFGYVENYALFVVAVAAYCFVGLLIFADRLSRWWILIPQLLAVFFHVFGLVLIPSTLLALLAGRKIVGKMARLSGRTKLIGIAGLTLLGVGVVFLFQQNPSSLAFSLMTVREEWFTLEGYTLFSPAHLLDLLNLLLILWPGLLIAIAALVWFRDGEAGPDARQELFLGLAAMMALGTAFFFDPKIGMARDWDLYAFAGIPLGVLLLHRLCSSRREAVRVSLMLFAVLGFMVLSVRLAVLSTSEAAFAQIHSYVYLDPIRNHNIWPIMIKYHMYHGDTTAVYALDKERYRLLPEERYLMLARRATSAEDYEAALSFVLRAADRYRGMPTFHSAYGQALLKVGRREDALKELQIALALNQYNVTVLETLGVIYLDRNRQEKAAEYWRRALALEPNSVVALYGMAAIDSRNGDLAMLPVYLERAADSETMKPDFYPMIAAAALKSREYPLAARALALARVRGFSDETIRDILAEHPGLAPHLKRELERMNAEAGLDP